jgi:hypothetical protein
MRRTLVQLIVGVALFAASVSTYSAPWGWLVQKTSGSATYGVNGTAQIAVKKGISLQKGSMVRTGSNGRVLLVRGKESVFIGPYTIAAIASRPTPGMQSTVVLQSGTASLDVRKKSKAYFSVETPYLVAVVKGTTFKVSVNPWSAEVSVQEGLVEVKALRSGLLAQVAAGQRAVVDANGILKLFGKGKLAAIKKGLPRASVAAAQSSSTNSSVGVSGTAGAGGVTAGASAGVGGVSVGASASVGSGGVSVGASAGSINVGAGARVGVGGLGVGVGIGGL